MQKKITVTGISLIIVASLLLINSLQAQPAGYKQVNPFHERYADSLKTMDYKPIFPIFGKKAYKKGFDIPLPYGVGMNYFYMKQNIDITNTQIGFNGGEPINLSDAIEYGDVVNTSSVITFRPDLWVLPFLNVYAVAGYGWSEIVVPITAVAGEPVDMSTSQRFGISSLGFGVTLGGGIGPVFVALDNNMNWAKTTLVDKAIPAYNLDARIGHSFVSARHPEQSITVWIGAFMQSIRSNTVGHIALDDVISTDKVADLKTRVDNSKLPQAAKTKIDNALNNLVNTTVDYQLDKKIAGPWNMIFGAQYQYNKHWQGRIELGTFGQRSQFMFSVNYRFQ